MKTIIDKARTKNIQTHLNKARCPETRLHDTRLHETQEELANVRELLRAEKRRTAELERKVAGLERTMAGLVQENKRLGEKLRRKFCGFSIN